MTRSLSKDFENIEAAKRATQHPETCHLKTIWGLERPCHHSPVLRTHFHVTGNLRARGARCAVRVCGTQPLPPVRHVCYSRKSRRRDYPGDNAFSTFDSILAGQVHRRGTATAKDVETFSYLCTLKNAYLGFPQNT